jgi:D-glycero-D-manno-heptose 1,7-bisphosphate phosphatase
MGRAAVFLDRDGTLNELALNPHTQEWESPHRVEELRLVPDLGAALDLLKGYALFVVSNQPSAAKGKCSLADLAAVHQAVAEGLRAVGATVEHYYYCYHHPQGTALGLGVACECRKPGTLSPRQAARDYGVDLSRSWFIGDQDFDVRCGRDAGCRSIVIEDPRSAHKRGQEKADFKAASLLQAARIVAADGNKL